ncbi:MAG TPA: ADOP family duplicated permease [Gemmatimonadaceae bacterium]
MLHALLHRLRLLFRRRQVAEEMDEELRFHLELETIHQAHAGLAAPEAERAARRRLGHLTALREERRHASGLAMLDRLAQDARYALRQLTRTPGFTAAVVLTLALGIGANATMFAIVDRVMLRAPDGLAQPERLVQLRYFIEEEDGSRDSSVVLSYPSYVEFRGMTDVFASVTALRFTLRGIDVPIGRGADARSARGAVVADHYFQTLGVRPAFGRFFTVDETNERAGAAVAVIGYGWWQRQYGGDPTVIGRTIIADGRPYTIIGVAPRGFTGHSLSETDIWLPLASAPGLRLGGETWATAREIWWLTVIARLAPGIDPDQALARVAVGWTAWTRPGSKVAPYRPYFVSLIPAQNSDRPEYRVARLLAGVALLLLLITCANVANLLLARALARRREIGIRIALGVTRGRLTMLVLVDAFLLAILGGAAALLVARWGIPVVHGVLFAGTQTATWGIDLRLVAVTMGIALVAGLVAGIVPALQASRPSLIGALRQGTREGTVHRSRTRIALLVAQGALSVALLAGTGLFVRSLRQIGQQHLGLDLDRVLVADFSPSRAGLSAAEGLETYREMERRVRSIPGVEGTALTVGVPLEGQYGLPLRIPGLDSIPGLPRGVSPFVYAVTPEFFPTMGTRIIAGRGFAAADNRPDAAAVTIVSAQMARLIWPDRDPIGQCIKIELRAPTPDCLQVVGVAEDARLRSVIPGDREQRGQYYVPLAQAPEPLTGYALVIRANDPRRVRAAVQRVVQGARPDLPYVDVRPLANAVAPELRPWRLGASVFGLFGLLALVVAAVGTYSVMQFSVSQRLHELGVRIALGARRGHLVMMVAREALRIGLIASLTGVVVVSAAAPLVQGLLYQTSARDPLVLGAVVVVLLLAAVAATLAPAWRATRADPVTALKAE